MLLPLGYGLQSGHEQLVKAGLSKQQQIGVAVAAGSLLLLVWGLLVYYLLSCCYARVDRWRFPEEPEEEDKKTDDKKQKKE